KGVDLRFNSKVESYQNGFVTLQDGTQIPADFLLLAIGVTPDNALAKSAGLALNEKGGIVVDKHMQTSNPNIYAVGDAVEVKDFVLGAGVQKPLAGPANKQGRIVADNICGIASKFEGTQGTAIVKVFGISAAVTGVNEKVLRTTDIPYHAVWLHPATHASYYPGSNQFALKVIFHKETGALLGAQAVGTEGVDKRIDVLATALRAKLTIRDLQELELCYAPPFSSAKDPVNFVGFVGANILDGYDPQIAWDELAQIDPEKELILDVRTRGEFEAGHITGAKLMPVDDLRDILSDLPEDKTAPIHLYCRVGIRGYIAARILRQNGYTNIHNLSGGWLTWENAVKAKKG
ncbi:MAG: FAD-dependent oxidoreductase, partial [Clostridiales Family XIII bacterium]|nr:FAD-dependent oxidoreductase [Clostridiales Family XIII bacterium]